jgi:hypothetical protein
VKKQAISLSGHNWGKLSLKGGSVAFEVFTVPFFPDSTRTNSIDSQQGHGTRPAKFSLRFRGTEARRGGSHIIPAQECSMMRKFWKQSKSSSEESRGNCTKQLVGCVSQETVSVHSLSQTSANTRVVLFELAATALLVLKRIVEPSNTKVVGCVCRH